MPERSEDTRCDRSDVFRPLAGRHSSSRNDNLTSQCWTGDERCFVNLEWNLGIELPGIAHGETVLVNTD